MEAEAVADEADVAVEAGSDGVEDAVAMAADGAGELDERLELRPGGQAGQLARCAGARVLELVEKAQLFVEQKGAVKRLVGLLDLACNASWSSSASGVL